jgi:arylsulfatase A-like enzyme
LQQDNNGNNLGLRAGDWKLVRMQNRGKSNATVSINPPVAPRGDYGLYHLANDPAERNDVSAKHPEELKRLQDRMEQIIAAGRSRPARNP